MIPHIIERLLTNRALVCEVGDDMHDAELMVEDGGLYCVVHQPPHTRALVPQSAAWSSYVIYDHPLDYPQGYVIRRFFNSAHGPTPTREAYTADTPEILDRIRGEMERCGLTRLARQPDDDPVILESWL